MTPSSRTKKIPVTCDPHGHLERRPLADLTPFQGGFKDLDDGRYAKLKASILAEGFMAPVFVWRDKILDGHQRTTVLEREGWDVEGDVPVVEIEADDEAGAARKLLKLTSAYGKPQTEGVFDFMQTHDLDLGDFADVDLPDFDEGELEVLFGEDGLDDAPSDEVPEAPATPVSREGDMWCMGSHRVLCGDSTADSATSRLFAGDAPFMMVTDPPYGVEYDPTWRKEAGINNNEGRMGVVQNDERADWTEAWALFPGDVAYVWHGALHAAEVAGSLLNVKFQVRGQIIWKKSRFVLSRGAYHWGHEPCWYAVRDGQAAKWCGDRKQSTVWDIALAGGAADDAKGFGHGTQKPVECMARPIRHHGKTGDIIYDPFLGSGTTLVAAHSEGRACLGMELHPPYVDVSVTRWQEYTNEEAILDGDGRTFSEVKAERLSGEDVAQAQAAG